jgi:hypothetical protein
MAVWYSNLSCREWSPGSWEGDGSVRAWDLATGNELCRLSDSGQGIHGVAFSPDSRPHLLGRVRKTALAPMLVHLFAHGYQAVMILSCRFQAGQVGEGEPGRDFKPAVGLGCFLAVPSVRAILENNTPCAGPGD